jgi:uncharacterized protein YlxW (UPF0749 family)
MNTLKKSKNVNSIIILIMVFSFMLMQLVQAVTPTPAKPGSDGDPIVTKSYVDKQIKSLSTKVNNLTASIKDLNSKIDDLTTSKNDLTKKVDDLTATINEQASEISTLNTLVDSLSKKTPSSGQKQTFKLVNVKAGKKLLAGTYTQIVLRSGKAKAISGNGGGIADLTSAKELLSGASLGANHLILVPLNDGRGFKAVTDVSVLICGTYTIA